MALFRRKHKHIDRTLHLSDEGASFTYVEAYKALRTNVDFLASTNNYKTFLITSAGPGEGKTNVAINLAKTLAEGGKKVILVDGDLRKGTIASYLKMNRNIPGIAHLLGKQKKMSEVIIHHDALGLDILTTGSILANAAEAMGSSAMQEILEVLYEMYDFVIIDTPPVSVVTDATILSRYVDGVILVARSGITSKQSLSQTKKALEDVNANILGVVLNDFNAKKHAYGNGYYNYYGYGYGYGYGGYGGEKKNNKKKKKVVNR